MYSIVPALKQLPDTCICTQLPVAAFIERRLQRRYGSSHFLKCVRLQKLEWPFILHRDKAAFETTAEEFLGKRLALNRIAEAPSTGLTVDIEKEVIECLHFDESIDGKLDQLSVVIEACGGIDRGVQGESLIATRDN